MSLSSTEELHFYHPCCHVVHQKCKQTETCSRCDRHTSRLLGKETIPPQPLSSLSNDDDDDDDEVMIVDSCGEDQVASAVPSSSVLTTASGNYDSDDDSFSQLFIRGDVQLEEVVPSIEKNFQVNFKLSSAVDDEISSSQKETPTAEMQVPQLLLSTKEQSQQEVQVQDQVEEQVHVQVEDQVQDQVEDQDQVHNEVQVENQVQVQGEEVEVGEQMQVEEPTQTEQQVQVPLQVHSEVQVESQGQVQKENQVQVQAEEVEVEHQVQSEVEVGEQMQVEEPAQTEQQVQVPVEVPVQVPHQVEQQTEVVDESLQKDDKVQPVPESLSNQQLDSTVNKTLAPSSAKHSKVVILDDDHDHDSQHQHQHHQSAKKKRTLLKVVRTQEQPNQPATKKAKTAAQSEQETAEATEIAEKIVKRAIENIGGRTLAELKITIRAIAAFQEVTKSQFGSSKTMVTLESLCRQVSERNVNFSLLPAYYLGSVLAEKAKTRTLKSVWEDFTDAHPNKDKVLKLDTVREYKSFATVIAETNTEAFAYSAGCSWNKVRSAMRFGCLQQVLEKHKQEFPQ